MAVNFQTLADVSNWVNQTYDSDQQTWYNYVTQLDNDVLGLQGGIDSTNNWIANVVNDVANLSGTISQFYGDVQALQQTVVLLQAQINALTPTDITVLFDKLNSMLSV
jgi:peptidoglycan hydrolase CwlO-like protein